MARAPKVKLPPPPPPKPTEAYQPITMADILAEPKYGDKLTRWMAGERVDDAAIYYTATIKEEPRLFSFRTDWGTVKAVPGGTIVFPAPVGQEGYHLYCKAGDEVVPDRETAIYKLACTIWNLNARGVIV